MVHQQLCIAPHAGAEKCIKIASIFFSHRRDTSPVVFISTEDYGPL